jgi:hypothetical protein
LLHPINSRRSKAPCTNNKCSSRKSPGGVAGAFSVQPGLLVAIQVLVMMMHGVVVRSVSL